jgi:hypothetical protein
METITTVILLEQLVRVRWISKNLVKVDDAIEFTARSDPSIDTTSGFLTLGVDVVIDARLVPGWVSTKGRDCCGEDRDAVCMYTADYLLVCLDDTIAYDLLRGAGRCTCTNVVDAFVYHSVANVGMCEDVAFDAAKGIGSKAIGEDPITASGLIDDGDFGIIFVLLQVSEEEIWPAIVFVGLAASSIGYRVADYDKGARGLIDPSLDLRDEVPEFV